MKKMKSIMTLGVFLMAFFVIGLQNANAQFQNATDAYTTLKMEYKSMTAKSVSASTNPQALSSNAATVNLSTTKAFISLMLNELNSPQADTAEAITSVYNSLAEDANGNANRLAILNTSKEYVENLLN